MLGSNSINQPDNDWPCPGGMLAADFMNRVHYLQAPLLKISSLRGLKGRAAKFTKDVKNRVEAGMRRNMPLKWFTVLLQGDGTPVSTVVAASMNILYRSADIRLVQTLGVTFFA